MNNTEKQLAIAEWIIQDIQEMLEENDIFTSGVMWQWEEERFSKMDKRQMFDWANERANGEMQEYSNVMCEVMIRLQKLDSVLMKINEGEQS